MTYPHFGYFLVNLPYFLHFWFDFGHFRQNSSVGFGFMNRVPSRLIIICRSGGVQQ